MAKQVALERRVRADANPEREEVGAKVDPALQETGRDVHTAQDDDHAEAVADRLDPDPLEERRAEIVKRQRTARPRSGVERSGPRLPERQIQDCGHEDGKERGKRGGKIARDEQQADGPPVRRSVVAQKPNELPQVTGRLQASPHPDQGAADEASGACAAVSRGPSARRGSALAGQRSR